MPTNNARSIDDSRARKIGLSGTDDDPDFPALSAAQERRLASMLTAHFDSVWRAGRRMGLACAQAEENAQETFALAARKLERIESGCERAFLLGVAVRLAVNTRRCVAQRLEHVAFNREEHDCTDTVPQADELLVQKRQRAVLDQILQSMSDTFREVLTLYEIEELTVPEIAVALDIPEGRARRACAGPGRSSAQQAAQVAVTPTASRLQTLEPTVQSEPPATSATSSSTRLLVVKSPANPTLQPAQAQHQGRPSRRPILPCRSQVSNQ